MILLLRIFVRKPSVRVFEEGVIKAVKLLINLVTKFTKLTVFATFKSKFI